MEYLIVKDSANAALVFWLGAILVCLVTACRSAANSNFPSAVMLAAGLWGLLGALLGGHMVAEILFSPAAVFEDPATLLRFYRGDKSVYGALVGATLFGYVYLIRKQNDFYRYADAVVPSVALGYGIARIGCFFNGCCFGTLSDLPWATRFSGQTLAFHTQWSNGWISSTEHCSLAVHPTQLYHAAAGFGLYYLLRNWKGKWHGSRMAMGLASYGVIRFLLQYLRGDARPVWGFIDANQLFSLAAVTMALWLWGRVHMKHRPFQNVMPTIAIRQPKSKGDA
jgi:phosphatidylglycerol:prolipoprotein diacylglycerol transferase